MKNLFNIYLIGFGILITGCGGSNTAKTSSYSATFIDSKVAGISYKCNNINKKTDSNGKFTCPIGSQVTFKLGDLKLMTISPKDGKFKKNSKGEYALFVKDAVPENTAKKIAAILLTLDSDGNPDNGITLPKKSDKIINEVIPDTKDINKVDVDEKVSEIANKAIEITGKDTFVIKTTEDAENHLEKEEEIVKKEYPQQVIKITGAEN